MISIEESLSAIDELDSTLEKLDMNTYVIEELEEVTELLPIELDNGVELEDKLSMEFGPESDEDEIEELTVAE